MANLNLDLDYFDHRKTIRLEAALGDGAAIIPLRLWAYVGKYHPCDGRLAGYSAGEIARIAKWENDAELLIQALTSDGIKFLEKIDGGYQIHDWLEHAGHLKAFKKRAKTAAKKRWRKYATSNATSNAKSKITNAPNLSVPNLSVPTKAQAPEAANAAPPKVKEIRPQTEVDPLVHLAADIGTLAPDKRDAQHRLCQWTISMVRQLKGEPQERVNVVVRASLERVREKFKSGYDVKNLWGLLEHIFKAERTRYIQGPEHERNKNAPMGSFGEIMDKIARAK